MEPAPKGSGEAKPAALGSGETEPAPKGSGEAKTVSLGPDETEPAPKGLGEAELVTLGETPVALGQTRPFNMSCSIQGSQRGR